MKEMPIVSVIMITYAHEQYIKDAVNGIFIQKTNFPIELIIANDCSPDNNDSVIKEMLKDTPANIDVKYTRHEKNLGMMPNFLWAVEQANGKYIAMCEGDDYWTDPHKLQKQVDYLESHKNIVASVTNSSICDMNGNILSESRNILPGNKSGVYNLHDFFTDSHQYPTLTVVFKNNYKDYIINNLEYLQNRFLGDWILWVLLLSRGNVYFSNEVTACYRVNPTSLTHTANAVKRWEEDFVIRKKLIEILPNEYTRYLDKDDYAYFQLSMAYRKQKKYIYFIYYQIISFLSNPLNYIQRVKNILSK